MAIRFATKTGNWSDVTVWDGGATFPQSGDTVVANNFTVTIDTNQNIGTGTIQTLAAGGGASGGGFVLANGVTLTANVVSGTTVCLTFSAAAGTVNGNIGNASNGVNVATNSGTGTLTINGNVVGGGAGVAQTGLTNTSSGTCTITGNVTAGTNAIGVVNSGTGTINVIGSVTGSATTGNAGISNSSSGNVNVTGNVTGGAFNGACPGISSTSTGNVSVTGNVTGGSTGTTAYGINSTSSGNVIVVGTLTASAAPAVSSTTVNAYNAFTGPFVDTSVGVSAENCFRFALAPSTTIAATSWKFAQQGATAPQYNSFRFMYTAGTDIGNPAASNVRYNTTFGPNLELTGTLRVPAAQYVSQGVLVDAGVGTLQPTSPDLLVSTTIATLSSQTSFTLTAGPTDDSALVNSKFVCFNAAGTMSCVGRCSAYVGSTKTVTLVANPGLFTMAIGDTVNFIASDTRLVGVPAVTAGTSGGLPTLDSDLTVGSKLKGILTTLLTETVAGYLAAAFKKLFDVAVPVFTSASVNQTADNNTILASGTFGNAALLTQIQNIQNNTFVSTTIPQMLEKPDSGSVTVSIVYAFADETGTAKNLDSGNPIVSLTNDAGTDLSSRLGSFTNPATGKYVQTYTNSASDTIEGLHWDVTGTVNSKLRRYPAYTQIVDTTAVDFTSADRTNLGLAVSQTTAVAIRGDVGLAVANLDTQIATLATGTALAAVATNATTAATQSTAAASSAATAATQSTNAATSSAAIKLKTDNLPSDPADASVIAAAFAAIPDAVWDALSEDSETMREAVRLCRSGAAGKLSGAGTLNIKMRDAADTKDRIDAVVDARGNRTTVTVDAS